MSDKKSGHIGAHTHKVYIPQLPRAPQTHVNQNALLESDFYGYGLWGEEHERPLRSFEG